MKLYCVIFYRRGKVVACGRWDGMSPLDARQQAKDWFHEQYPNGSYERMEVRLYE